ncbi:MAG: transposase [Pseudomonadota bacterium]
MSKKKQPYTDQFRREAVRRADEPGVNATQVAKDLGVSVNQIYNWRSQYKKMAKLKSGETIRSQFHKADGVDYSKPESDEVRALRKENQSLKEELEFLKKATAYFANQNK